MVPFYKIEHVKKAVQAYVDVLNATQFRKLEAKSTRGTSCSATQSFCLNLPFLPVALCDQPNLCLVFCLDSGSFCSAASTVVVA